LKYLLLLLYLLFSLNLSSAQFESIRSEEEAKEKIFWLNDYFRESFDEKIYFNSIYFIVTRELQKERNKSQYSYPHCLERMIVEFANMYLDALSENSHHQSPLPWQDLFNFEGKPTTHLLLGMNAHISYDLPISLYRISKRMKGCSSDRIKNDYFELNHFFTNLIPHLNRELKETHYFMNQTKSLDFGFEEAIMIKLIKIMRNEAWKSYLKLLSTKNSSEFEISRKNLEKKAHEKAVFIMSLNFFAPQAGY